MAKTVNTFTDYTAEAADIDRRRKLAELLQQQALEPIKQETAGGYVVPISWTQGLAKALQGGVGAYQESKLKGESKDLAARRNQALAEALGAMPKGTEGTAGVPEQSFTPSSADYADAMMTGKELTPDQGGNVTVPAQAGVNPTPPSIQDNAAWLGKLGQIGPDAVAMGGTVLGMQQKHDENALTRAGQIEARKMAIEANMAQLQMKLMDKNLAEADRAALQMQLKKMDDDRRREMQQFQFGQEERMKQFAVDNRQPVQPQVIQTANGPMLLPRGASQAQPIMGPDGKPVQAARGRGGNGQLPTQALKLRQEEVEAIGTGASINADLGALDKQIDEGKLKPSLLNNAAAYIRNNTNYSTEESRNIGSYNATLEKLRNDSLRLNKGVQTEGDAVRAWNELMGRSNDTAYVQQRLKEIQKINDRAINIRKMNVDAIHQNYGLDPMDVSGYQTQPAAVGSQQDYGAPPPGAVRQKKQ